MTLGNIGKASSAEFAGKRKLLLLPYVVPFREDAELRDLVETYWNEAIAQVRKLEASLGPILHVFHEGVTGQGEEALGMLQQGNPFGFSHIRQLIDRGAALEPVEDMEALAETMDLHRCLQAVQVSQRVLHRLLEWFKESRERRYTGIAQRIDQTLKADGTALLIISQDHGVQFPGDIDVIYVAPPALDRINRWMREHPPLQPEPDADSERTQDSAPERDGDEDKEEDAEA